MHRLSVAWSLSLNKDEFVKVDLPSVIKPQLRASLDFTKSSLGRRRMSWEDLHEVVKNWRNLNDERPFLNQQTPFLLDAAEEGLTRQYPDLELATLDILELEHKESPKAIKSASKIRAILREKGHQPISWLISARKNL